MNKTFFKLK